VVRQRVAAIGLDAAEWTLVERLLAEGELPHLAALRRRGAEARLHHSDYRTGLVWEHFLTGKGARGNRRWSAVEFDPRRYEAWQLGGRKLTPFYSSSQDDGGDERPPINTIAFDVPYTTLTGNVHGVEVTSWGGHDPGYPRAARPPGLLREIEALFGPHPAFGNDYELVWYRPGPLDALADALVVGARRRADISLWLQRRFPDWNLFVTVLSEPHSAGELMWHGVDDSHPAAASPTAAQAGRRLREVYRAVDDAVGRITAALPPDTTLMVFSMFGMGPNDADLASMALLPELLYRQHFKRPFLRDPDQAAWRAAGYPPILLDPQQAWSAHMKALIVGARRPGIRKRAIQAVPDPLREAYRAAKRARRDDRRARQGSPHDEPRVGALGRRIAEETDLSPEEIGQQTHSVAWQIPYAYRPYWPQMPAFAVPTFYDGRVRINVEGRERDGVVAPADYRRACDEVVKTVRACRNPRTGRGAVAEVVFLRADDPLAPEGPEADIQIVWTDAADAFDHPDVGTIGPFPYRRTGGHSPNGFMFLTGPGIARSDLGQRDALDVTPTILALTGRLPARDLEGIPLLQPGQGAEASRR
jgi:predicted AlkP superfamily phosphohydrolase/phosphomutase